MLTESDFLIDLTPHGDARGYVMEAFRKSWVEDRGCHNDWVLEIQSYSAKKNTLRGMHFQIGAGAQAKLVRCIRGEIRDVIVDIRHGSPSFGKAFSFDLSANKPQQLYVPRGFAHGFVTLCDDVELIYNLDNYYSRDAERGIRWNDSALAIDWKLTGEPVISERDSVFPSLSETPAYFSVGDGPFAYRAERI
ncbi:MAG: dTDP-4-dehydrorhamnose 3,5-epimerase [Mesorhizobium sp.]|uniref:dTDP-4-dehydrorhamnose 3,5-epimerase n=1 Tax=Mesorhizobium sp. TaxID=1871066 RepID=UPI001224C660|nr:dTDP-4-dehydrorhamnose 3,5-epimerase [Mesorhizobium sp.]TIQ29128.1 MAG: dTDP-4-dehydrorhamnose 3,5-epimerase [Mesorhizobium sp.]